MFKAIHPEGLFALMKPVSPKVMQSGQRQNDADHLPAYAGGNPFRFLRAIHISMDIFTTTDPMFNSL